MHIILFKYCSVLIFLLLLSMISGCAVENKLLKPLDLQKTEFDYVLGPGDVLDIFVWRNSELSVNGIPVRPDGKISTPLVEDLVASGITPKKLARAIEGHLAKYIKDPFVTVTVRQFNGRYSDKIRIMGEVTTPQSLSYQQNLTLLDVMLLVGGLTEFAAGNRASIVRTEKGKQYQIPVRIKSLLKNGDISANVVMLPGDILVVPESWF